MMLLTEACFINLFAHVFFSSVAWHSFISAKGPFPKNCGRLLLA